MAVTPDRDRFSLTVAPDRSVVSVVPEGELDIACVEQVDREVRDLRRAGFDHIVVDLRKLRFLDSTGLRMLLSLRNDARRDGHTLQLVPGGPVVQRVFEITRTQHLFDWRVCVSGGS